MADQDSVADRWTVLVERALNGDQASRDQVVESAYERIYAHAYRMTMNHDHAGDLSQETVTEVMRVFGKLREADRFWPWVFGILRNKRKEQQRLGVKESRLSTGSAGQMADPNRRREGLVKLVTEEIEQAVVNSMKALKPEYREILSLRCYEGMSYEQIAQVMDRSTLNAHLLFFRAKRALAKRLSAAGLGGGSLVLALSVFGKLSSSSSVAVAGVSVAPATLKVGSLAWMIGTAGSTGFLSVLLALIVLTGSYVGLTNYIAGSRNVGSTGYLLADDVNRYFHDTTLYFPSGLDGPMMMRRVYSLEGSEPRYVYLQNERNNYVYDNRGNTVYLVNHRHYNKDLSPLDVAIDEVRGQAGWSGQRHLVVTTRQMAGAGEVVNIQTHDHALSEQYFRYNWPADAHFVDRRDDMRKRGWGLFTVTGHLGAERVEGRGYLPFYYEQLLEQGPWLKLRVGDGNELLDSPRGAMIIRPGQKQRARVPAGSLFTGLMRPWKGFHTLDLLRRDAELSGHTFVIDEASTESVAVLHVQGTFQSAQRRMTYRINMGDDLIERIIFQQQRAGQWERTGQFDFTYDQRADEGLHMPPFFSSPGGKPRQIDLAFWMDLAAHL